MKTNYTIFLFASLILLLTNCKTRQTDSRSTASTPVALTCPSPPDYKLLEDIDLVGQKYGQWCWAATTQMALQHFNVIKDQQVIATDYINNKPGAETCATVNNPTTCNKPQNCAWVLTYFGFSGDPKSELTQNDIINEIGCNNRPIVYCYYTGVDKYHITLIVGYEKSGSDFLIMYNDPLPLSQGWTYTISYDKYINGIEDNDGNTYYTPFNNFYNLSK